MAQKNFSTIANHKGTKLNVTGKAQPKIPPIVMSGAYSFTNEKDLRDSLAHRIPDYDYGREGNATNDMAAEIMCALDEGVRGVVYSTGMSAIITTALSQIRAGDHVILSSIVFGATHKFFVTRMQEKFGLDVTIVNLAKDDNIEQYMKPNTKLVYMETISNPTLEVIDIRKIAEQAHKHGAKLIVDNTFATPVVCQPLTLGADFVVYSATKFMNGHSDIMAGAVVGADKEDMRKVVEEGHLYGPAMSPFDGFLLTRSLRTLEVRMKQHCANAMKLAEYLSQHDKVRKVCYPGLATDPYHETATQTFNGLYGGMVSIELDTFEQVMDLMDKFDYVKMVPSLGALSTTYSDTRTSHSGMTAEARAACGINDKLMRISVGLENIEDIIADFEQALKKV